MPGWIEMALVPQLAERAAALRITTETTVQARAAASAG